MQKDGGNVAELRDSCELKSGRQRWRITSEETKSSHSHFRGQSRES